MELPPGFRFHPTDEELITHYLSKKVLDINFTSIAIGEVDMNSVEPWDLPWMAKIGEKEWYFFCVRDKKYPTGLRTNRATMSGYWKATGKDKDIFRGKALVGMKKTLVFYKGRAPKGVRTNWVCHEYRLEGKSSLENLPKSSKNDWVISRVFLKTNGGKKVHVSGLMRMNSAGKELITLSHMLLPPLMDPSPSHVHCFSNNVPQKSHGDFNNNNYNNDDDLGFGSASANPPFDSPWTQQFNPSSVEGFHYQFAGSVTSLSPPLQDNSALKKTLPGDLNHGGLRKDVQKMISVSHENTAMSIENSSVVSNNEMKKKKTFEEHEAPILGVGTHDLDSFWNY